MLGRFVSVEENNRRRPSAKKNGFTRESKKKTLTNLLQTSPEPSPDQSRVYDGGEEDEMGDDDLEELRSEGRRSKIRRDASRLKQRKVWLTVL